MAALDQVTGLVSAHVTRDYARFRAITLQIAANLAGRSPRGADRLRKLVENSHAQALTPLPSAKGLLSMLPVQASLGDMVLASQVRGQLDRVILEHTRKLDLFVSGLGHARKLLFVGPPGCGKTMSSGALARAVGLPLFRVNLHGVIQSHLGETAAKLSQVFEHVSTMPAVYLFDEFDALGAERNALSGDAAGGEMRRVVNSLLQFIEDDQSESMIIAATNHPQVLDRALFRRFDETITFALPSSDEVAILARRALGEDAQIDVAALYAATATSQIGHADVCAALRRVRKDHILLGTPIDTTRIVEGLAGRARVEAVA